MQKTQGTWVQHKSGQGEKWRVTFQDDIEYEVESKLEPGQSHWLPLSEYVPCDPPRQGQWIDVTSDCILVEPPGERAGIRHCGPGNAVCELYAGYVLRKLDLSDSSNKFKRFVFVVEQRCES